MACKNFKGDIGTIFRFTIKDQDGTVVDISTATTKQIKFCKADQSTETRDAAFTTTGADGKLQVSTIAGDLDVTGPASAQPYIAGVSGFTGHGEPFNFRIYEPIA